MNKNNIEPAMREGEPAVNLPAESTGEFATFPAVLRALVEAELAAGNSIAAFEHGFPAAPCGASIKLARAVGESRRKSTGDLSFYERNNSNYAGEFTTAERHFFVLEPPLPAPPPPDMDAIRQAYERQTDERPAHEPLPNPTPQVEERSAVSYRLTSGTSPAAGAFTGTETPTGWTRVLHFRDTRPPHEVQFALERELMSLFTARMKDGRLCLNTTAEVNGARYDFEIQFTAAVKRENHFTLHAVASWGDSEQHREYFRKTSDSWFKLWVCDLMPATPPEPKENELELYRQRCEATLNAERHLDSVAAVQQAIIDGMKKGGSFGTSHKEGGTNIYWRVDHFVRSDYGEDPGTKKFRHEAEFLKMLWNFCQFDVTRCSGKRTLPDLDTWKLILRRMSPSGGPRS